MSINELVMNAETETVVVTSKDIMSIAHDMCVASVMARVPAVQEDRKQIIRWINEERMAAATMVECSFQAIAMIEKAVR